MWNAAAIQRVDNRRKSCQNENLDSIIISNYHHSCFQILNILIRKRDFKDINYEDPFFKLLDILLYK